MRGDRVSFVGCDADPVAVLYVVLGPESCFTASLGEQTITDVMPGHPMGVLLDGGCAFHWAESTPLRLADGPRDWMDGSIIIVGRGLPMWERYQALLICLPGIFHLALSNPCFGPVLLADVSTWGHVP